MRKLMALSFGFILVLFSLGVVSGQGCVIPTNGMVVNSDVTFCEGDYNLLNGLMLSGDNVDLDCNGARLIGNTDNPSGEGIRVLGGSDFSTISNCIIMGYHIGITLVNDANSNTISNNVITMCNGGLTTQNSMSNNIIDNNFDSNLLAGVIITNVNDVTITGNEIVSSGVGINFDGGALSGTINDNTITDNTYGIRTFTPSSSNVLIYNNFFENLINSLDSTGTNDYNTVKNCDEVNIVGGPCVGGNFWHDYMGDDTNGDGIGDTLLPYDSNGNIIGGGDSLPLLLMRNTAPVLAEVGVQEIDELNTLEIDLEASDDDEGDVLEFFTDADSVLPSAFSFDSESGLFSWTPQEGDEGIYIVTFGVSDGFLEDVEEVIIVVHGAIIIQECPIFPEWMNGLDIYAKKKNVCAYAEFNELEHMEGLGWSCDVDFDPGPFVPPGAVLCTCTEI